MVEVGHTKSMALNKAEWEEKILQKETLNNIQDKAILIGKLLIPNGVLHSLKVE